MALLIWHENMTKKPVNNRRKLNKTLAVAILSVVMVGLVFLGLKLARQRRNEELYQKLKNDYKPEITAENFVIVEEPIPTPAAVSVESVEAETQEDVEEIEEDSRIYVNQVIDFDELSEVNPDIYAWISIDEIEVNYPVLQCDVDDYYLNRNLDHSKGFPGCIYSNVDTGSDFESRVTILYGHDLNNNKMFGALRQLHSEEKFDEVENIVIYTPECRLTYQIIIARRHNDNYLPIEFSYFNESGMEKFLQFIEDPISTYDSKISHRREAGYSMDDKYLVLSTCVPNENGTRYIVVSKLIEVAYYK